MNNGFILEIPLQAEYVVQTLRDNGYEAYVVGGCVRDQLLQDSPQDWDVTTSADPDGIKRCFSGYRTIETGISHGTVGLFVDGMYIEVTSYRIDGVYSDNRRPDSVIFTGSLTEDLGRRDFTVNAMAYNRDKGLIDPFDGLSDIKASVVRSVNCAYERFNEDALRILRGLRFASQLSFLIEEKTSEAILGSTGLLKNLSAERIAKELEGIITGYSAKQILLEYKEVFLAVIPELSHLYSNGSLLAETLDTIMLLPPDPCMRYAVLLKAAAEAGEINKTGTSAVEGAEKTLKRLKYSRDTVSVITAMIQHLDSDIVPEKQSLKRSMNLLGPDCLKKMIQIKKARSYLLLREANEDCDRAIALIDGIISDGECYSLKQLAVNGDDLITEGIPPGERLGNTLSFLLEGVIAGRWDNTKEVLLDQTKQREE